MIQYLQNCLKENRWESCQGASLGQSTNKRVIVARFDRESLRGVVQSAESGGDSLDLLNSQGALVRVPFSETKAVCFVRDPDEGETWLKHRTFLTRPKTQGLWIRLRFRDGDTLEGIVPNNLMSIEPSGFTVVPPDPTFQNQRIFVPREALVGVEVLGVIGSPLRRRKATEEAKGPQLEMFE
jgi:hypothetical protein